MIKGLRTLLDEDCEIPKATFEEISSQRVLKQRLYHTCMDIVTESLKHCSHAPVRMTDANGDERLVRTILFVHLADLPEQLLISCCHGGALQSLMLDIVTSALV